MNIPNFLTMLRILLIPLLVIFLIEGKPVYAFLVFVAAGVSDALDGFIARMFRQKTVLGAYLDPIADKLLLNTSFVALGVLQQLPAWLAVLVVSRDVIILGGLGVLMLLNRPIEIKPSLYSKVTTLMQLATVCFYLGYAYLQPLHVLEPFLIVLAAGFTVFSGFHYITIGFRILGKPNHVANGGQ